jgi:hypothetical protein
MCTYKRHFTFDFRLRQAMHAVLTQRRLDEGVLSVLVPCPFDDAFTRDPSETISGFRFSPMIVTAGQVCKKTTEEEENACLSREGRRLRSALPRRARVEEEK